MFPYPRLRSKAWYELSRVTPEQGVEVLTNLSQINPNVVQNLTGYIIGIMTTLKLLGTKGKRAQRNDRIRKKRSGPGGKGGKSGKGGKGGKGGESKR